MTSRASSASLAAVVALLALAAAAPSSGAAGASGDGAATGRVLVVVDGPKQIGDVADDAGLETAGAIPQIGVFAVPDAGLGEVERALAGDSRVVAVEREHSASPRYTPDDPGLSFTDANAPGDDFGQWNLINEGFRSAWGLSRGGNATVAVIDSGADLSHPDLAGAQALDCSESGSGATCTEGPVADSLGHGTHVAGLACGDSDNGFGIASAGFDCNLLVVRTDFEYLSIAKAIVEATDRGADAINLSLGGDAPSVVLRDAIDYAWDHDSIPVAAADNHMVTNQGYPAGYVQQVGTANDIDAGEGLVVTAAQHSGARASFAGFGNGVSVAAFGSAFGGGSGGQQGVLSTYPGAAPQPTYDATFAANPIRTSIAGSDRFAYLAGTSMATPQVSGLVALIRSAKPGISAGKLVKLVKQTAGEWGTFSSDVGWGVIDAYAAVAAALGKDITRPASRVGGTAHKHGGPARSATLTITSADVARPGMPTSGLERVSVFVSRNGAPYTLLKRTLATSLKFRPGQAGTYRFYSVASDQAGNVEATPSTADRQLKLRR